MSLFHSPPAFAGLLRVWSNGGGRTIVTSCQPPKRIHADQCCSAIIDYQDFFLAQLEPRNRSRLRKKARNFARLLAYLRIPTIVTLERPVHRKGAVPQDIKAPLGSPAKVFEKDFLDLTKEKPDHGRREAAEEDANHRRGIETDVCVLQSCLGLLELGFEVFAVEELLFSRSRATSMPRG